MSGDENRSGRAGTPGVRVALVVGTLVLAGAATAAGAGASQATATIVDTTDAEIGRARFVEPCGVLTRQ